MQHDLWIEVDLAASKHNLRQVRAFLPDGVRIMAVVKANGYGHGYVEPSRAFVEAGADALAVTRLEEAMAIREAGIDAPILLLAPIQAANAETAIRSGLDTTITSISLAQAISEAAAKLGATARVHVKVDTGMGRLGVAPGEAVALVRAITDLPGVEIAGIYTHFASAAERDCAPALAQSARFFALLDRMRQAGIQYGLAHAANSAAILRLPASQCDMVRPGTLLYGQYPSPHVPRLLDLKPTWRLKARVCEVKTVPRGARIGYGGEHVVLRQARIAIVPVGWADGYTLVPEGPVYRQSVPAFVARRMKRRPLVELRGAMAPVVGRVAVQMTAIDVTAIAGVEVGDEVTIPAMRIPTSALVPRVYVDGSAPRGVGAGLS